MKDDSLTQRLRHFMDGDDPAAVNSLAEEIMPELRRIAFRELRKERYAAPVRPTELIDEFWLKYLKRGLSVKNRGHFYALVGEVMGRILVDMARRRLAKKRGTGEAPLAFEESGAWSKVSVSDDSVTVELGILMEGLKDENPDAASVVYLHVFVGYSIEEIADQMGLRPKQVAMRWKKGKIWLGRRLRSPL